MIANNLTPIQYSLSTMTDVQFVQKYCGTYNFFLAGMLTIIGVLILVRAVLSRKKRQNPKDENISKAYTLADDFIEILTGALIVFQFLLWWWP